jgi:hypothetical protein
MLIGFTIIEPRYPKQGGRISTRWVMDIRVSYGLAILSSSFFVADGLWVLRRYVVVYSNSKVLTSLWFTLQEQLRSAMGKSSIFKLHV